jgi:hypothetical protein
LAFAQHTEIVADHMVLVTKHVEVDLADRWRTIMPCLVAEMRVCRYRIDFNAHGLQICILVGEIFQFGWADKRPVCWVEEKHGPFALNVGVRHFDKFARFI